MSPVVAPPPRMPSRFGAGMGAWGAMFGATLFALCVSCLVMGVIPASILAWAAMFPIALLGAHIARHAYAERTWLLASVLALIALPPVAVGALSALGAVIVSTQADYTSMFGIVVGPIAFFLASIFVLPVALFVARSAWRGADIVLRSLAYAAVFAAVGLAAVAMVHGLHRPTPDGYVGSLPLVATLDNAPGAVANGDRVRLARHDGGAPLVHDDYGDRCAFDVSLVDANGGHIDQVFTSGALSACAPVGLRRDDANGYWVFTNEADNGPTPLLAVDMKSHANVQLDVPTLARSLSAPRAWIALSVAGALAAVAGLLLGGRRLLPLRERVSAVPATHLGQGQVRLADDSPPFLVDRAAALPMGPVLLVGATQAAASAYRENSVPLAPRDVVAGTPDDARRALASAIASQHAFAFTCAALAATPLAVAAYEHLVF